MLGLLERSHSQVISRSFRPKVLRKYEVTAESESCSARVPSRYKLVPSVLPSERVILLYFGDTRVTDVIASCNTSAIKRRG